MSAKILLVEGSADRDFYRAALRVAGINGVDVQPPTGVGAAADGIMNAIDLLPALIAQLNDGSLKRLALVVDADHPSDGRGFRNTYARVTEMITAAGYVTATPYPNGRQRFFFVHRDGLPDFYLWIMPDQHADGMLEDFVEKTDKTQRQAALQQAAASAVGHLVDPLFNTDRHGTRARIYTWLAWQRIPGKSVASCVGDSLIVLDTGLFASFRAWLADAYH